ncbi:UGSC family (seleno)protein [Methanobacterium aggregans]|uniref:UGSC family (seleno)protein n=1 Tax=Methanobacterium aggregans TaxID=1615586 RepID=UPI001AE7731A|nr:UGSC family (seleno)protein [Methanobacterium aggregans]MBP2046121.1 hypothetical protein [Methanobacterium aggregans]
MKVKITERDVLNPLAETEIDDVPLNPIPDSLSKISLFDNTKPGASVILSTIQENLEGFDFISADKPAGATASPDQMKKAADADLCILALGDCGSCTTWVVLDAVKLEKRSMPTICICSTEFSTYAGELASSHGAADLRIMEIQHPIAGQSNALIQKKALKILPELKKIIAGR